MSRTLFDPKPTRGCGAVLILLAWLAGMGTITVEGSVSRIVVVGDVHGDLNRLTSLLKTSRLIDSQDNWTGDDTVLVLTGDLLDRGSRVREVLDLVMRLEEDCRRSGGQVITLFGNHEMMNIIGDLRYTTTAIYARFADNKSEKRREDAYKKSLKLRRRQAERWDQPVPTDTPEFKSRWMKAHPPGFIEYREAFGPRGEYGRWIRRLPTVVKVDDVIFVHGGIDPSLAKLDLDDINKKIKAEIESFDSLKKYFVSERLFLAFDTWEEMLQVAKTQLNYLTRNPAYVLDVRKAEQVRYLRSFLGMGGWLSIHPQGPLWFRGYGRWTEQVGRPKVAELLDRYEARYFVVGHTVATERDITARLGGAVFLVDTVLPSALEIQEGQFTAVYLDGRKPVSDLESSLISVGGSPKEEN